MESKTEEWEPASLLIENVCQCQQQGTLIYGGGSLYDFFELGPVITPFVLKLNMYTKDSSRGHGLWVL